MAKSQKKQLPPPRQLTPPQSLVPLMQAFHAGTDEAARLLVTDAAKAISFNEDIITGEKEASGEEIEVIIALMRELKPHDTLETFHAAQIIATHVLGMRKLASTYSDDQKLGLKMLRFSNEALQYLQKKRGLGGEQNITVNYNYNGPGNAVSQTVIKEK